MKIKLNDDETQAVFAMITFMVPLISEIVKCVAENKPFVFSEHVESTYEKVDLKEMTFALCSLVKGIEPIARSKKYKEHLISAMDEIVKREMVVMH